VGVTVPLQRRRKEEHPIPASRFCFKEIFMLVPALTNGPDFRHSRVASGDLADITPTQPSPIKGGGLQDVWHCRSLSFAFLAQFCNCILKT
jgi:hypothetical protein